MVRSLEFLLIVLSLAISIRSIGHGNWRAATASGALALSLYGLFYQRIRRAHFAWDANLLALPGLPLFSYLLLRSKLFHDRGKVLWKGRNYPSAPTSGPTTVPRSDPQEKHDLSHAQS
jgi:hypothetical protein